jgi:hypothetical protein
LDLKIHILDSELRYLERERREMERLVKKFEQRYRRARCHLATWSDLQSRLLKQFSNAVSILDRLPVLGEVENYGILKEVKSMAQVFPASQIESFEKILSSIHSTFLVQGRDGNNFEVT